MHFFRDKFFSNPSNKNIEVVHNFKNHETVPNLFLCIVNTQRSLFLMRNYNYRIYKKLFTFQMLLIIFMLYIKIYGQSFCRSRSYWTKSQLCFCGSKPIIVYKRKIPMHQNIVSTVIISYSFRLAILCGFPG